MYNLQAQSRCRRNATPINGGMTDNTYDACDDFIPNFHNKKGFSDNIFTSKQK
jgi:hypothetical protein